MIEAEAKAPADTKPRKVRRLAWLGVVPFFLFTFAFLIYPSLSILIGAFQNEQGRYTTELIRKLLTHATIEAYWTSIKLSVVTALLGGLMGFLMAYAVVSHSMPRWVRSALTTFSGVAANFAGVPLAFAFIATLGVTGIITKLLKDAFGIDLYGSGFSLYSFAGLVIVYLYFQIPLMILVIAPALDGLRREWREAALNLGAGPAQYWRLVALPVLMPSLLGAMLLLFGSAFGAYATAYALTSGQLPLVPLLIGQVETGNVLSDPHFGDVLALGMVLVLSVTMVGYAFLQRKASRWQR